jgi:hypothetical protein
VLLVASAIFESQFDIGGRGRNGRKKVPLCKAKGNLDQKMRRPKKEQTKVQKGKPLAGMGKVKAAAPCDSSDTYLTRTGREEEEVQKGKFSTTYGLLQPLLFFSSLLLFFLSSP